MVFLNRELKIPTWLVMVNFVNDSFKPTSLKEWKEHYLLTYREMGFNNISQYLNKLILIFPEALK